MLKKRKPYVILAVVLVLGLAGCATIKEWTCSPGAALVSKAITWGAQLAALQPFYPPGTVIGNAILAAKPQVDKLRDGYCVSDQDNFITYLQGLIEGADEVAKLKQLQDNKGQTFRGLKSMGLK